MDITALVVSTRAECLIDGNYGAYRKRLSKKILNLRHKLGIATKHRGKYKANPLTSPSLFAESADYARLEILIAERAWAHAMTMKAIHTANNQMTGSNRSHMISRLEKAARVSRSVVHAFSEMASTDNPASEILQADAYASTLQGAVQQEKRKWQESLESYSRARVVYGALLSATKLDMYKQILAETIDPSVRYAAYQLDLAQSLEIPAIARRCFPRHDTVLISRLNEVDPSALGSNAETKAAEPEAKAISWRGRNVVLQDPAVATAWGNVEAAKAGLCKTISTSWSDLSPKDRAAAYEQLLNHSQDAVDATKTALDELRADGVTQGDARMQSLLIARTAMSYEMVSWRIGRNRVLTGDHDGAIMGSAPDSKRKRRQVVENKVRTKTEPLVKQITRLKEKVALYNSTLQSLDSVREISGVASDQVLSNKLEATARYFKALKCLAIARSHAMTGKTVNALALIKHAYGESQQFAPQLTENLTPGPPSLEVGHDDARFLSGLLQGELHRARALVRLDQLTESTKTHSSGVPLIETLQSYPPGGVSLERVVRYPPVLEPIPVQPLYLDIAWNYLDYPSTKPDSGKIKQAPVPDKKVEDKPPAKKGWFGFGR